MPSPSTLNPRTALVLLAKNTSVSESELCDLGHDIIHVSYRKRRIHEKMSAETEREGCQKVQTC